MKNFFIICVSLCALFVLGDCKKEEGASVGGGMASVEDSTSQKNVVGIAVGSKDHTTLVAAVKAADLVDSLANPGPFTVFAPTNDAFAEIAGVVEGLTIEQLSDILQYHVVGGANVRSSALTNGQVVETLTGTITINISGSTVTITDGTEATATVVLADVQGTNGVIHVIDKVLLK